MAEAAADRALVQRMAKGDEQAVNDLVVRHGDTLYALAFSILQDRADAEEVAADAFMQAWRTAGSFDPARGSVLAWLTTVARTRALDRLRTENRRGRTLQGMSASIERPAERTVRAEEQPDRAFEAATTQQVVQRALQDLPEPQRRVIELAYFGGLSQSEIAARLDLPLGTVKTRTLAAMKGLRTLLSPLLGEGVA